MIPLPISMPVTYRASVISLPHTSAVGTLGQMTCETCVDLISSEAPAKDAVLAEHSRKHHTEPCGHEVRADTTHVGRTKDGKAVIMRKGARWTVVPLRWPTSDAVDTIKAQAGIGLV